MLYRARQDPFAKGKDVSEKTLKALWSDALKLMPEGMEDASKLPRITEALVRRGYADRDIRKILGENAVRVLSNAERVANELAASAV